MLVWPRKSWYGIGRTAVGHSPPMISPALTYGYAYIPILTMTSPLLTVVSCFAADCYRLLNARKRLGGQFISRRFSETTLDDCATKCLQSEAVCRAFSYRE